MVNERSLRWYHENKHKIDKEKRADYMKQYRLRNLDKWKRTPEQQDKYNANRREKYASDVEHRDILKSKAKQWQKNNPQKRKAQRLNAYNITIEKYNEVLEKQGHACAICGYSDTSDKNFFPVVDHCHSTGKVRGLLCANCNHAIGKMKDDINILKSAIVYLEMN